MNKTNLRKTIARNTSCALLTLTFLLGCVCSVYAASAAGAQTGWDLLPEILSRIVPPTFPDRDFVVTDYGAVGDGVTDCNPAFKKAIAACTKTGGRVVVPKGVWLTNGPIHLDNNVNLHISEGATIKFGTNYDDYLPHVLVRWAGTECYSYSPLIYAYKKTNIAVTGSGTLDGQAKSSWVTWQSKTKPGTIINMDLRKMGAEGVPVEKRIYYGKPSLIMPFDCKNVLIEGLKLKDYPFWCVHLTYCTNATVRNVTVVDGGPNPNNDGCDADSCTDVLIENCGFNTGDDSICVKAGRDQDGWRVGKPSQNIIIRNMTDWHGLAIGSEMSGGVKNVFLQNCSMDRGAAVYMKSNLDRGGFIKDIYVKDIKIGRGPLLRLRNNYHGYRGGNYPADFRDIFVENVTIKEADSGAIFVAGVEGAPVKDIFLKNCTIEKGAEPVTEIQYAENIVLDNVYANGELQPTHPKQRIVAPGTGYISAIRDGNWSDTSIWDVWKMDGIPDGKLPASKNHGRVMIGGGPFVKDGVTVTLDMDIDEIFELRIYKNSTLIIPSGTTFKVAQFRPDRSNSVVRQTGGTSIIGNLNIDDVTCQYFITGGTVKVNNFNLGEGSLIIDDSSAAITSISVTNAFHTGAGTTTKFIAHKNGIAPMQCKDVHLGGEKLIVDVTRYDYAANGDLTLVSYTGTRTGKFDGGTEKPTPQVTIIGGNAELVYDDAAKQIKLTNFGQGGLKTRISENER